MFELKFILRLFGETLQAPDRVAAQIKTLRMPHDAGWSALALVTIVTVLIIHLERMIPGAGQQMAGLGANPVLDVAILGGLTAIMVFVVYFAGRMMDGKGSFGATLLLITWFQVVVMILVVIQVIVGIVAPLFGGLFALASLALQLWCLTKFVQVLHEYDTAMKAAGVLLASFIGVGVGLFVLVALVGGTAMLGNAV